jgi:hypothetical protein
LGVGVGGIIALTATVLEGNNQYRGMVMLGACFWIGYTPASVLAYLAISGIAWGFLIVVYLAVPGDLSPPGAREKFYALGIVVPLIIYGGLVATSRLLSITAPAGSVSSILSIILFMSIIPVLRAVETLPETKIVERKLSDHLKKVGKIIKESEDI